MRTGAGGCWLVVGLLLGCGLDPSEVMEVYQGQGSSSGSGSGESSSSGGTSAGTGPIADGTAGSDTGMPPATSEVGDTTGPVDPETTAPGTTTEPPAESTGPEPGTTTDPSTSSSSDGGMPPASCDELFDTASGYVLCMHDAGSCSFNVLTNGQTCTTICNGFGQTCLGGLDNPSGAGTECMIQGMLDCSSGASKSSTICICTRS